jgi:hypothetical protein
MDREEASLTNDLTLQEDVIPTFPKPISDALAKTVPITLNVEPNLTKLRQDIDEAPFTSRMTDKDSPTFILPNKLIDEPNLQAPLNETIDPKWIKSKALRLEPNCDIP